MCHSAVYSDCTLARLTIYSVLHQPLCSTVHVLCLSCPKEILMWSSAIFLAISSDGCSSDLGPSGVSGGALLPDWLQLRSGALHFCE